MDLLQFKHIQTRRDFFKWCAGGIGTIALHNLLELEGRAGTGLPAVNPLTPKAPNFTPKAKNVIFLFMEGAPSHLDLYDPKPAMAKWDGQIEKKRARNIVIECAGIGNDFRTQRCHKQTALDTETFTDRNCRS